MNREKDYILGTHDEEIERLGLQHRVWRPKVLDAWKRAGFTIGQKILDVGCGPGYASLDLAEIVGPSGKIFAVDRSRRFLDRLEAVRKQRGLENISTFELDLDEAELPAIQADGAWCRWVFAFVKRPRELLKRIGNVLKPGGILAVHEYFDYGAWQFAPRSPEHEEFVRLVMESWRATGGEPDIGLSLPGWLQEMGFELKTLNPIIEIFPKTSYWWQWPKTFIDVGIRRMVDLGYLTADRARGIAEDFAAREAKPGTLMITPAVLEIIAVKR
ncbi:MAG: methyltransferase domain-containing protein [candidate division Zixibacteria bacterium]|nr:methyltransferase domain-containing protein [candidate division Zixibacteria bacterium]